MVNLPQNIDATVTLLLEQNYVCSWDLATVLYLCLSLDKPLFLEGEAGVGKTEIAKAV
ncbi:MAG: MoxR family ATPase, partial [Marinovum sp.]|nr:MoxR family ATPase [Marinovum sp.]